jgi:hypothetical protein
MRLLLRPVVYLGHPIPGGYKYGDLPLQFGLVSRIETIKYGLESPGTQTQSGLRCRGPVVIVNYRPLLSSERALPQLSKENLKEKERLVTCP